METAYHEMFNNVKFEKFEIYPPPPPPPYTRYARCLFMNSEDLLIYNFISVHERM